MEQSRTPGKKILSLVVSVLCIVTGMGMIFYKSVLDLVREPDITVEIKHSPVIMPAAYKVYANPEALNGKYNLFRMLVTNEGKKAAAELEVSYDIPGYIDHVGIAKIPVLLPGQSTIVNCFPKFQESIVEKTTTSKERANIKIVGKNTEEVEESFPIEIRSRNDFVYTQVPQEEVASYSDLFDNNVLLACLVTPEDPIIKYYTQQIQEKVLKGESASVENKEEEGVRFLGGIYEATLRSHMVYSGTAGVPVGLDDVTSMVQHIRLPREVVTGNTGLCIELSALYASVMMSAGLDPVIYLMPGHAYPGFVMNGTFYAIEATGIGGEGMKGGIATAEQAFKVGMENLQKFMEAAQAGDPRYTLVNIRDAIQQGALAMELKDDSFLRKKIDDIAAIFDKQVTPQQPQQPSLMPPGQLAAIAEQNREQGGQQQGGQQQGGQQQGGQQQGGQQQGGQQQNGDMSGLPSHQGEISFSYPSSWHAIPGLKIPYVVGGYSNASGTTSAIVYSIPSVTSPDQAMASIQQVVESIGDQIQYSLVGENNGYTVFQGQTFNQNMGTGWQAVFKRTANGFAAVSVGVTVGTPPDQDEINSIFNSLR